MGFLVCSYHTGYVQDICLGIWYVDTIQYTYRSFDGYLVYSYHAVYMQI